MKSEITVSGGRELRPVVNVDELVALWLEWVVSEKARPTVAAYSKGLRLFREFLAESGLDLERADTVSVRRWRDELKKSYSVSTVNLWLSAVRSFYAWGIEEYGSGVNPAAAVRGASRKGMSRAHKRSALTSSEVRAVLDTCDDSPIGRRDRAILSLMVYCALRSVEVQRLELVDLDSRDDWPVLWVRGKGRVEADEFVVLTPPVDDALRSWLMVRGDESGPLFYSLSNRNRSGRVSLRLVRLIVKSRMRQAGIANGRKTTHSLRHTAITSAIRNGASPLAVQAMARHKSFDTTMLYVHEVGRTADPAERYIDYG